MKKFLLLKNLRINPLLRRAGFKQKMALLITVTLLSFQLFATNLAIEVTGKISDEAGVGVPGVTILEKGTKNGTVTNVEGKFTLKVANTNSTLVFSSVGFSNQEVNVGTTTNFNISMKTNISSLDEVVVVGYGVQKKQLFQVLSFL